MGSFHSWGCRIRSEQAVEQYGTGRINRDGVLPWQIGEYSLRLTHGVQVS